MERNEVVLVDMQDRETGTEEKIQAHRRGHLHRAFSVFLYRGDQILLQRRALQKYHCGGLWTNTCCSHPGPGEDVEESARKRLKEEMGISVPQLTEICTFVYRAEFGNGMTEFEYDHIFAAPYSGDPEPDPDPQEVEDYRWIGIPGLMGQMEKEPHLFTPWFITALKPVAEYIRNSPGPRVDY